MKIQNLSENGAESFFSLFAIKFFQANTDFWISFGFWSTIFDFEIRSCCIFFHISLAPDG